MANRLRMLCGHLHPPDSGSLCQVPCSGTHSVLARGVTDERTDGLHVAVDADGVAIVRLSNDKARNPLSKHVLVRLRAILHECLGMDVSTFASATSVPVRCLVIASTGSVFCSGHDMKDFVNAVPSKEQRATLELCAEVNMLLARVPQPTVALVDGYAMAGGCQLAASCDLLLATPSSKFALPGVRSKEGFCHTPSVAVAGKIGRKALRVNLLGDDLNAQDAKDLGLVDKIGNVDELEQTVHTIANRFDNEMARGKLTFYEYFQGPAVQDMYNIAMPAMSDAMSKVGTRFAEFLAGNRSSYWQ